MGRRANGEGTVFLRKDGCWSASITLIDGTRKTVYAKTKTEAADLKHKLLQEATKGEMEQFTSNQTVEVFLLSWLEDTVKPNLRWGT